MDLLFDRSGTITGLTLTHSRGRMGKVGFLNSVTEVRGEVRVR